MEGWEISVGCYPRSELGFRSYVQEDRNNHVLYLPFLDVCLTILNKNNEQNK